MRASTAGGKDRNKDQKEEGQGAKQTEEDEGKFKMQVTRKDRTPRENQGEDQEDDQNPNPNEEFTGMDICYTLGGKQESAEVGRLLNLDGTGERLKAIEIEPKEGAIAEMGKSWLYRERTRSQQQREGEESQQETKNYHLTEAAQSIGDTDRARGSIGPIQAQNKGGNQSTAHGKNLRDGGKEKSEDTGKEKIWKLHPDENTTKKMEEESSGSNHAGGKLGYRAKEEKRRVRR